MSWAVPVSLAAALLFAFGNLFQKGGLDRSAEKSPDGISAWAKLLLRNPRWLAGIGFSCLGALAQYAAAANWNLSVVQPLIGLNPVVTALLCARFLGERAHSGLWLALLCALGGVVSMGLAGEEEAGAPNAALWPAVCACAAFAVPLFLRARRGSGFRAEVGLAVPAGIGFGLSAALFKAAWSDVGPVFSSGSGAGAVLAAAAASPAVWAYAAAYACAFFVSQAALAKGRGMLVVPLSAAVGNLVPVLLGIFAFGEPCGAAKLCAVVLLTGSLAFFAPRRADRAS